MFSSDTIVLIVDDSQLMRQLLEKTLDSLGLKNCIKVGDGEMAWKFLKETTKPIGLVLSNWNMPGCDGLELLHRVRNKESLKNLPFVMVTAEREFKFLQKALKAGVTNYINKPFTTARFKEKLEQACKKSKL